jgi:hypothetical protein
LRRSSRDCHSCLWNGGGAGCIALRGRSVNVRSARPGRRPICSLEAEALWGSNGALIAMRPKSTRRRRPIGISQRSSPKPPFGRLCLRFQDNLQKWAPFFYDIIGSPTPASVPGLARPQPNSQIGVKMRKSGWTGGGHWRMCMRLSKGRAGLSKQVEHRP